MRTAPLQRGAPVATDSPAAWKLRVGLVAIVLAAYANAFGLGSALDGEVILHADPRIRAVTGTNLHLILTTDYWGGLDRLYRPLTTLSFLFNYAVLGNETQAAAYHAVNILLHALNVLLVFGLAARWFGRRWPAFWAAALWAVHPVGVDTVTNVAGRADLMASAGLLGALTLYVRWKGGLGRVAAYFGLALAAIASKETGAVLIPLMLACDAVDGKLGIARWKSRMPAYAAALAAIGVYFAMRLRVFASMPPAVLQFADNPLLGAGFWQARWTAVRMLGADLLLLVWPARLASDRSFDAVPLAGVGDVWAWASLVAVIGLATVAVIRRREDKAFAWGAAVFALTLLPSSNLVVLIGATMAERFLYLPAIGFCLGVVTLVYRVAPRRVPAAAVLAVIGALFAGRTMARNPDWDNNVALMSHDEGVVPRNYRVHHIYGETLVAAGQLEGATVELEKAWAILSPLPPDRNVQQVPVSLARCYLFKREPAKALDLLLRADAIHAAAQAAADRLPRSRLVPGLDVYMLLGDANRALGRDDEAVARYRQARGMVPTEGEAYDRASAVLADRDPGAAALAQLERALVFGTTPQAVARLAPWYSRLPDGGCAVVVQSGVPILNPGCARLRADLCRAYPELVRMYAEARQPERAAEFEKAASQYGCRTD